MCRSDGAADGQQRPSGPGSNLRRSRAWWVSIALGSASAHLLLFFSALHGSLEASRQGNHSGMVWAGVAVVDFPLSVPMALLEVSSDSLAWSWILGVGGTLQWFLIGACFARVLFFCWTFGAEDEAGAP